MTNSVQAGFRCPTQRRPRVLLACVAAVALSLAIPHSAAAESPSRGPGHPRIETKAQPTTPGTAPPTSARLQGSAAWANPPDPRDRSEYYAFSRGLRSPEEYRKNRHLRPREAAAVVQDEYGRGSVLGRSAAAVAAIADAAERGSQAPLDKVNVVTGEIIGGTREALGMGWLPDFRLRSEVRANRVGIGVRTRW